MAVDSVQGVLLALDTSTSLGSVAVGRGGELIAEISLNLRSGHSSAILPAVDYAMRAAGVSPADLEGVVVGGGPGSFTGLRVAGATAKGIVHALGVPLFSFTGLLASAAQAWSAQIPVCALFDARGRELYAACYSFDGGIREILSPGILTVEEVLERLGDGVPPVFTGDGSVRYRAELELGLGARVAPTQLAAPRAAALLWLASVAPAMGLVEDARAWEPRYLRASGAERIAAAISRGGGPP